MPEVNTHFKKLLDTCIAEAVPDTTAAYLYTHDPKDRLEDKTFPSVPEPSLDELKQSIFQYKEKRVYFGRQN